MNWYKKAQAFHPNNLEDRNVLNDKIRYFEHMRDVLAKLSKVVFQDGKFAKEASYNMANEKQMSSYPSIQELLLEADRIALDSPWKFASLCEVASAEANKRIKQLAQSREELVRETNPMRSKGWIDRHARRKHK